MIRATAVCLNSIGVPSSLTAPNRVELLLASCRPTNSGFNWCRQVFSLRLAWVTLVVSKLQKNCNLKLKQASAERLCSGLKIFVFDYAQYYGTGVLRNTCTQAVKCCNVAAQLSTVIVASALG